MRTKHYTLLVIFLSAVIASCQGGSAGMGPAEVMDAYTKAINDHDLEKALSYVADDAVYERPTGSFNGKEEIRMFIESLFAQNVKVELIGERTVVGDKVTWTSRVTLYNPNDPNAPPTVITNNSESTVRNGKIVHHKAVRAP